MISKAYTKDKNSCKVTFELDPEWVQQHGVKSVHLAGDFNDWNWKDAKLTKRKTGAYSTTLKLDAGRAYQFRYVVNESDWVNDSAADAYQHNGVDGENSVVQV
jgi:1,4-alpha-glucan branching enzyme